MVDYILCN
jgi:hypothetical protein